MVFMGMTGEHQGDRVLKAVGDERASVHRDAFVITAGQVVWYRTRTGVIGVGDRGMMHDNELVCLVLAPEVLEQVHLGVGKTTSFRGGVPNLSLDFPSAVFVA